MGTPLTTPISEVVTQFDILRWDAALTTNLFTVTVRLSNVAGTIVHEQSISGIIDDLTLPPNTLPNIKAALTAFLKNKAVVN